MRNEGAIAAAACLFGLIARRNHCVPGSLGAWSLKEAQR